MSIKKSKLTTSPITYVNTESVDTESVDTESVNTESVDTESVDTESVNTESVDTESVDNKGGISFTFKEHPYFKVSDKYLQYIYEKELNIIRFSNVDSCQNNINNVYIIDSIKKYRLEEGISIY